MLNKLILFMLICVITVNCNDECVNDVNCAERQIQNFVEEIDKEGKVQLLGDFIIIEKTGENVVSRTNENLGEKIANFMSNHLLKVKLPTDENSAIQALEESRKSKLKKIILPLILLLKLKAALIIPAVLSAIALVAFKGLGASLVAMTLAGATAFKSLLDNHASPKVTYEVVPQLSSHWSRSGIDGIESYPIPGYHTIAL